MVGDKSLHSACDCNSLQGKWINEGRGIGGPSRRWLAQNRGYTQNLSKREIVSLRNRDGLLVAQFSSTTAAQSFERRLASRVVHLGSRLGSTADSPLAA